MGVGGGGDSSVCVCSPTWTTWHCSMKENLGGDETRVRAEQKIAAAH